MDKLRSLLKQFRLIEIEIEVSKDKIFKIPVDDNIRFKLDFRRSRKIDIEKLLDNKDFQEVFDKYLDNIKIYLKHKKTKKEFLITLNSFNKEDLIKSLENLENT